MLFSHLVHFWMNSTHESKKQIHQHDYVEYDAYNIKDPMSILVKLCSFSIKSSHWPNDLFFKESYILSKPHVFVVIEFL